MPVPMLESYAAGRWFAAADEGTALADAVTGAPVARISSTGLDVAAMVDHAREVGGPALRSLSFQQRAAILRDLGVGLLAAKGSSAHCPAVAGPPMPTRGWTSTAASAR